MPTPRTKEEVSKLTIVELKNQLKALGAPVAGNKPDLVERLLKAEADQTASSDIPAAQSDVAAAAPETAPAEPAEIKPTDDADAAPADAHGQAETTAAAEPALASGKHAKISFSADAIKAMPDVKLVVVKPAAPAPAATAAATPAATTTKSVADKLKERADKFKDPDAEKAKQRAQRFGLEHPEIEKEKAMKRAERFGTFNPDLDAEKKKARMARFGIDDPAAKAAARAERFKPLNDGPATGSKPAGAGAIDADAQDKLQARAARFAAAVTAK